MIINIISFSDKSSKRIILHNLYRINNKELYYITYYDPVFEIELSGFLREENGNYFFTTIEDFAYINYFSLTGNMEKIELEATPEWLEIIYEDSFGKLESEEAIIAYLRQVPNPKILSELYLCQIIYNLKCNSIENVKILIDWLPDYVKKIINQLLGSEVKVLSEVEIRRLWHIIEPMTKLPTYDGNLIELLKRVSKFISDVNSPINSTFDIFRNYFHILDSSDDEFSLK